MDNLELGEVDSLKNGTFSELVLKSKIEEEIDWLVHARNQIAILHLKGKLWT